jgi:hypothetical protein
LWWLSCGFEADGLDECIKVIDDVYARARVMGSYPEIVAKPNICVTEMPSNAIAVLLRSGRDQPSSWARWTFRRETGSAAFPAQPS